LPFYGIQLKKESPKKKSINFYRFDDVMFSKADLEEDGYDDIEEN